MHRFIPESKNKMLLFAMVSGQTDNQKQADARMLPGLVAQVRRLTLELVERAVWGKTRAHKSGAYRPFLPTNVARYPWPCVSSTVSVISRSWNMDSRPATVESQSTGDKQREGGGGEKESGERDSSARLGRHAGLNEKLRRFLQSHLRIITVRGGWVTSSLQVTGRVGHQLWEQLVGRSHRIEHYIPADNIANTHKT